jgi:transcriptional regulator with XRE-family HTH domain
VTNVPLQEELPRLLRLHGISLRALAAAVGVNQSHLSRVLGAKGSRPVSGDLAGKIAVALGMREDYFPEFREAVVIERIRRDPALRDRLYSRMRKRGHP